MAHLSIIPQVYILHISQQILFLFLRYQTYLFLNTYSRYEAGIRWTQSVMYLVSYTPPSKISVRSAIKEDMVGGRLAQKFWYRYTRSVRALWNTTGFRDFTNTVKKDLRHMLLDVGSGCNDRQIKQVFYVSVSFYLLFFIKSMLNTIIERQDFVTKQLKMEDNFVEKAKFSYLIYSH